ncbi:MAG: Hsp70 family protein, partial [Microcystaceae cyanobacterium]
LMNQVMQQGRRNGILPEQIDRVLLVGGTAQIPVFQDWVKGYFNESKIAGDRPFDAIALGALQLTQGQEIKDFLYHSYGIRYWNRRKNCHSWHPIIKSGQAYPMPEPVELVLGASLENQPSIEVIMGELGAEEMATEIFFDGDRLRTRTLEAEQVEVRPLNDQGNARQIALLDPPGQPGSDRIKIRFWVDQQRFLRISVEDLLRQTTLLDNQAVAQLR